MMDEIVCSKCRKPVPEHQLTTKSMRIESCPFCGTVVRTAEGVQGSNVAAQNASDIAAIDEWLNERKHSRRVDTAQIMEIWTVETPYEGTCEVHYERRRPGVFLISLMRVGPIPKHLEFVCACHGVQFCQSRSLTDSSAPRWGAFQNLGMFSLLPELFNPVLKRLNEAVEASQRSDSNSDEAAQSP
jgi:hypothetical protein